MLVGSVPVSLDVLDSPPPDTATELVTLAGALAETLTVSVMAGKLAPPDSTALVVQVSVAKVQTQPVPVMAVAVKLPGKVSTTVTLPLVDPPPEFFTVMV